MSTNLLGNSKAALVFAGLTILVAVVLVGPQGGSGLIGLAQDSAEQKQAEVTQTSEASPTPETAASTAEPLDPASGWGGTPDPVFGDYSEDGAPNEKLEDERQQPENSRRRPDGRGRGAPRGGSIGGPVKADLPGTLVPRPDETAGANASSSDLSPPDFR